MKGKVAVIGSPDFVLPFKALGLDIFSIGEDESKIPAIAEELIGLKYSLVVVAENIAPIADTVFSTVERETLPAVVVVPFTTESEGFAIQSLGRLLKLAMGIDIVSD